MMAENLWKTYMQGKRSLATQPFPLNSFQNAPQKVIILDKIGKIQIHFFAFLEAQYTNTIEN